MTLLLPTLRLHLAKLNIWIAKYEIVIIIILVTNAQGVAADCRLFFVMEHLKHIHAAY